MVQGEGKEKKKKREVFPSSLLSKIRGFSCRDVEKWEWGRGEGYKLAKRKDRSASKEGKKA